MPQQPLLTVSGLSKKYCKSLRRSLLYGVQDIAGEFWLGKAKPELRRDEFWALDQLTFEVRPGDAVAIMGSNGAGKSTLLKLINGLIKPDGGTIKIRGRIGSLIELSAGLSPVLTGRENVFMQAALHGIDQQTVHALFDQIVSFAELEAFIDSPVQAYSSGMTLRLAYATIAHFLPDMLLIDEALAVGDIAFRRKCIDHMRHYVEQGGALLFVSHSPFDIQSICQRGILLERGKTVFSGTAVETLNRYFERQHDVVSEALVPTEPSTTTPVVIDCVSLQPESGDALLSTEPARMCIEFRSLKSHAAVNWGYSIWSGDQLVCLASAFTTESMRIGDGFGRKTARIPRLSLAAGVYTLRIAIIDSTNRQPLALHGWSGNAMQIRIHAEPSEKGNALRALNSYFELETEW